MKLKYYLRGAGIGIIISTFIFSISLLFYQPSMSEADIKKEAEKLGMVVQETKLKENEFQKEQNSEQNKKASAANEKSNETTDASEEKKGENVIVTVNTGDSSAVVCVHLQESGLIDNANAFDAFLSQQNMDHLILPGEYTIPEGSSYLEIAEILTTKK